MAIKLIATDLNGTLLRGDQSYHQERLQRVLNALRARGIRLALTSGNQYAHLKALFAPIEADNLVMVAENGASIYQQAAQLFDGSLSAATVNQFITVDRKQALFNKTYLILVGAQGSYTELGAPQALLKAAQQFYDNLQEVPSLATVTDKIKKISVSTTPAAASALVAALNKTFAGRLVAHDSGYGVIDLVASNVGKLPAVQWLAQRFGLAANEIMAFGDGDNDVPLLQYAGLGIAMRNAPAKIQAVANQITALDNEHDGVLDSIESLVLNKA
ncbi:HAD family hydrolase [Lactobacillus sp. CBA3606]|uniref:Cof-type HAD-IIB family hydrolase n=1 Tax=Lactobacillus sp. CBA3606 TaxID=2099789 RepID=UPI000CFC2788|nr:Cof-type HAD-IIB family hydrolase [Lactobacillus sp. CBA3606]AVK64586.1 HAD family hydrolase [Lactobacillus sp. CBA3606]